MIRWTDPRTPRRCAVSLVVVVLAFGLAACGDDASTGEAALRPIPRPELSGLGEAARSDLEGALSELEAAERGDLVDLYGRIGRTYHAYGLFEPAMAAYRNAADLDPDDFRWPYLLAVIETTRGAVEEAESGLRRALATRSELTPELAPAALRLADLLAAQNRWQEAAEIYQRVVDAGDEPAAGLFGLGRYAAERADHAAAVERFERVRELQPGAETVRYLLGLSYRELGDRDRAAELIAARGSEPVRFADPEVDRLGDFVSGVGTPIDRALHALAAGDYDRAVEQYEEALEIDPESAVALRGLALVHRQAGDFERSAQTLDRMLQLYPDHRVARLDLGTVLLESGELDRAVGELREAIRRQPDFKEAHFNLGVALTRANRWREARDSFRAALEIDPRSVNTRYHLAMALDQAGEESAALAELERVLAEAPEHLAARQRLALVRAAVEGPDAAAAELRALIERNGVPVAERAVAYFQLGRLSSGEGDYETAIEHYRTAAELDPELWQARYNLANSLLLSERPRDAAVEFAALIAADPTNVFARVRESKALAEVGEYGIARARLEEGLERTPRSAELAHALARILVLAPQPAVRDGARALDLAEGAYSAEQSLIHAETVAMALAEVGRFEEAIRWQEELLARARDEADPTTLDRLRRGLELLRQGRPLHEVR